MHFQNQLHAVSQGRIFVRSTQPLHTDGGAALGGDPALVLGLVVLPRSTAVESIHQARLNDALWLDTDTATKPRTYQPVGESDVAHLLTDLRWARSILPDAMGLFVRASALEHHEPGKRWCWIGGVIADRPACVPADGIYELRPAPTLVDPRAFHGEALSSISRKCLWGPGGEYGFATTMELQAYHAWLPQDRAANMKRDRSFARFAEIMAATAGVEEMVYRQGYADQREAAAKAAIVKVMLEDEGAPAIGRMVR